MFLPRHLIPWHLIPRHLIKVAGAMSLAILLSGCIVAPCCGGYYHHPHYWGYR